MDALYKSNGISTNQKKTVIGQSLQTIFTDNLLQSEGKIDVDWGK